MILLNKKKPDNLLRGKITAIDKTTGRISVFLKNGLYSVAIYLGDLDELQVGTNVLLGRVDDQYIIINRVQNVPRLCGSFTKSKPLTVPWEDWIGGSYPKIGWSLWNNRSLPDVWKNGPYPEMYPWVTAGGDTGHVLDSCILSISDSYLRYRQTTSSDKYVYFQTDCFINITGKSLFLKYNLETLFSYGSSYSVYLTGNDATYKSFWLALGTDHSIGLSESSWKETIVGEQWERLAPGALSPNVINDGLISIPLPIGIGNIVNLALEISIKNTVSCSFDIDFIDFK